MLVPVGKEAETLAPAVRGGGRVVLGVSQVLLGCALLAPASWSLESTVAVGILTVVCGLVTALLGARKYARRHLEEGAASSTAPQALL